MADLHADREHATWSASAASRNFKCPGALALTMHLPETTSEAADWGTCAHQIAEKCLRGGFDADTLIGTTEKGKKFSNEVDEEMAETAQVYVDYCRKLAPQDMAAQVWVEQRFSLADLKPPFDAGGTADFVCYVPHERRLEIVDLKGGRGVVVAARNNPQIRTYALGALLANKGLDVADVTVTIVQPRASHPDGRIRSETFHVADLVEWTADMMVAMRKSAEALEQRPKMPEAAWAAQYLTPGDHCADTFCKAAGTCPALEKQALDAAGVWFNDLSEPQLVNAPDSGDPAQRAARLDMLDMIEDWIKAVRAHEHRMAESGQPAEGYVLVQKQGREKWVDGAEDKAGEIAVFAGVPPTKVYNPAKLRTPKQVRAEVAKTKNAEALAMLADLSATPETGTNLVKADKTTRAAVAAPVNKHFSVIE
jgi:hypothetical protein